MVNETSSQAQDTLDGRGRQAGTPVAIPLPGWKDILVRLYRAFGDNNLSLMAAGVSFFGLLALFPAIGAFVALYGLFQDPQAVVQQLSQLDGVIPSDVVDTLTAQMRQVASGSEAKLGVAAIFSLLVASWSARMGTNALMTALNVVYGEREKRGFIWTTLTSLALTVAIILGLISIAFVAVGAPLVFEALGAPGWLLIVGRAIGIAMAAFVLVFGIASLYRWAPSRRAAQWRWVGSGALMVVVFWVVGSLLFSFYVAASDRYSATYGSLGAVIILLTWLYITVLIMLIGGELNAQLEYQTGEDTTVSAARPMGERGAFVADKVAPAPDDKSA